MLIKNNTLFTNLQMIAINYYDTLKIYSSMSLCSYLSESLMLKEDRSTLSRLLDEMKCK